MFVTRGVDGIGRSLTQPQILECREISDFGRYGTSQLIGSCHSKKGINDPTEQETGETIEQEEPCSSHGGWMEEEDHSLKVNFWSAKRNPSSVGRLPERFMLYAL
jgi:hypothetical protein